MQVKTNLLFLLGLIFFISCSKDRIAIEENEEPFLPIEDCINMLDNWEVQSYNSFPIVAKQRDVFFVNSEVGYSVGNAGNILKTNNGGETWDLLEYLSMSGIINPNLLTSAILSTIYFVDESVGYVGGGRENFTIISTSTDGVFLSTENGGSTWQRRYIEDVIGVADLFFSDRNNGVALVYMRRDSSLSQQRIIRTEDAGETWNEITVPIERIDNRDFESTPNSLMIMGINEADETVLLVTNDLGLTWESRALPHIDRDVQFHFVDDENIFALIDYATTYKTTDGGLTWEEIEAPYQLSSLIHFNSPLEGFIINSKYEYIPCGGFESCPNLLYYEVSQTFDGGVSWTNSRVNKDCDLEGLSHSPSKDLFFIIGCLTNVIKLN